MSWGRRSFPRPNLSSWAARSRVCSACGLRRGSLSKRTFRKPYPSTLLYSYSHSNPYRRVPFMDLLNSHPLNLRFQTSQRLSSQRLNGRFDRDLQPKLSVQD